jgi:hypothetical protein
MNKVWKTACKDANVNGKLFHDSGSTVVGNIDLKA